MMDANGDDTDEHLQHFIRDTALQDVVAHLAPELKGQSTYTNGKKRLDYILVSEELLEAGTKAGHTARIIAIGTHSGMTQQFDFLHGHHLLPV